MVKRQKRARFLKKQAQSNSVICAFKLFKTSTANLLTLEFDNVRFTVAEVTEGAMLGKDNLITVDVYLDGVSAGDFKLLANLLRNDYSAKFVDVSNNTG